MKIVIAGAGDMGTHLAKMLSGNGHDITVADVDPKALVEVGSNKECPSGTANKAPKNGNTNQANTPCTIQYDSQLHSLIRLIGTYELD